MMSGSFRVSGRMHDHPKCASASPMALSLWLMCGAWRADYRTVEDWYSGEREPMWLIPTPVALAYSDHRTELIDELVRVGLWEWVEWHDRMDLRMTGRGVLWDIGPAFSRPTIPARIRKAVYERDGHACVTCGATDDLSLDHIEPYSLGGADVESNLQTMCRPCNSRKGARV